MKQDLPLPRKTWQDPKSVNDLLLVVTWICSVSSSAMLGQPSLQPIKSLCQGKTLGRGFATPVQNPTLMGCRTLVLQAALHPGDISVPKVFLFLKHPPPALSGPGVSWFCLKTCTWPAWPRFHLLQHTQTPVRPLAFILLPKCCYMKPLPKIKIKNTFPTDCCLPAGETEAKDACGTSLQPEKSLANSCPGLTPTDWRPVCCDISFQCFTRSFFLSEH